ncbi:hypothetical protein HPB51_007844 [Rhipicephalus microplus]|uniref:Uncharacterized protein n=1 Tax=Rhipicephalus microplus TaxID=6941 RepID=A0A9J6EMD3_RHIMP|nr:hypothetical protein HPB51_007844 [Rhipicephalus microplus]
MDRQYRKPINEAQQHDRECHHGTYRQWTVDSFLIQYDLEDHSWLDGRRTIAARKARQKFINTKKPVRTLKAMSALERLLCLSDGNFMCLNTADLDILAPLSKLKGISAFCINENPTRHDPFSIQVCAAKRKQLQLYAVTENKVAHQSDISLSEHALALVSGCDASKGRQEVFPLFVERATLAVFSPFRCGQCPYRELSRCL